MKILVFSNAEPDLAKLSADRWDIHHMGEGLLEDFVPEPVVDPTERYENVV